MSYLPSRQKQIKAKFTDESGSLTIFSLFLFLAILMISGLAVDLAHHEHKRVKTQNALDTAVLAAASVSQTNDKKDVIRSYLTASGLNSDNVLLDGQASDGESVAWAFARARTNTIFSHLLGIEEFDSSIFSQATERFSTTEISLVLDFSSSMQGARIASLRDAVEDFVNVVYGIDCETGTCVYPTEIPDVTINIVPYGGAVNPGPYMAEKLGLKRWHSYSDCAAMVNGYQNNTDLPYGSYEQLPHFYLWRLQDLAADQEFGWCPQSSTNSILYAENDPEKIKTYMAGLNLNDGTGTHLGLKWGLTLLDASNRGEINDMVGNGIVTGNTSGNFPADNDASVMKFVVLMTDGGITSLRVPTDFDYANLYDGNGELIPDNLTTPERDAVLARFGDLNSAGELRPRSEVELTEPLSKLHADRANETQSRAEAIANLESLCNLARQPKSDGSESFTVFTLRFLETAQWTENYMKPCATNPESQYYDVQFVDQLDNAFTDIGRHINNLRLSLSK